jgi:hypothetical protein
MMDKDRKGGKKTQASQRVKTSTSNKLTASARFRHLPRSLEFEVNRVLNRIDLKFTNNQLCHLAAGTGSGQT